MDFWKQLDALLTSHKVVIDRPRGTAHPRYPALLYPLDYGYLKGSSGGDGKEIDVWVGSLNPAKLIAVICTVDSVKGDAEVKLLTGCTEVEINLVEHFYNDKDLMSCLVVRRNTGKS